jgi:hypothetical protein
VSQVTVYTGGNWIGLLVAGREGGGGGRRGRTFYWLIDCVATLVLEFYGAAISWVPIKECIQSA